MKCNSCGASYSAGSSFCVSCGRTLSGTYPNEPSAVDNPRSSNLESEQTAVPLSTQPGPDTRLTGNLPDAARKTNVGLIAGSVIGVLGFLLGAGIAVASLTDDSAPRAASDSEENSSTSSAPGGDSYLDRLWRECAVGDFQSCDDLFSDSPAGSEYEEFWDTCGNRNEPSGWCVDIYS